MNTTWPAMYGEGCNHRSSTLQLIVLMFVKTSHALRAESQSGLTHEKYIPTYRIVFQKLLMIYVVGDFISHLSLYGMYFLDFWAFQAISHLHYVGLDHSGSRPFNL